MSSVMKIHREQIIETAMLLLDRDGLEGVTLRRVAAELDVHVGAIYWHVHNKQELLDEMALAELEFILDGVKQKIISQKEIPDVRQ